MALPLMIAPADILAIRSAREVGSGLKKHLVGEVDWSDQANKSARFIESRQHIYADNNWLELDTHEGVIGLVRLDGGEALSPGPAGEKSGLQSPI